MIRESTYSVSASIPALREAHPVALVRERLGDHRHGQDIHLLGDLRDDRCGTCSGAATHARGDEHHVRTDHHFLDAIAIFFRRRLPDRWLGSRAQSLGDVRPDLQLGARLAAFERLRIGVDDDEFDALHTLFDHVVHCVAAAAAHTDHLDHRILRLCFHNFKHRRLLKIIAEPPALH